MKSRRGRKKFYIVRTHPGGRVISRHYKLSIAKKVASKRDNYRVYDQDGRLQ